MKLTNNLLNNQNYVVGSEEKYEILRLNNYSGIKYLLYSFGFHICSGIGLSVVIVSSFKGVLEYLNEGSGFIKLFILFVFCILIIRMITKSIIDTLNKSFKVIKLSKVSYHYILRNQGILKKNYTILRKEETSTKHIFPT